MSARGINVFSVGFIAKVNLDDKNDFLLPYAVPVGTFIIMHEKGVPETK